MPTEPDRVVNLIRHVIWDLHEGVIGVGGATTRGYGTITLVGDPPPTDGVDVTEIHRWARSQLAAASGGAS